DTPLVSNVLGENYDAVIRSVSEKIPVKRIGTPEEVAEAVIMLMNNGFINGEVLHIDGGERLVSAA
ncbi:MAG: SDR family oxidoreductase, partial [Microcystaceae cyanobacterium]